MAQLPWDFNVTLRGAGPLVKVKPLEWKSGYTWGGEEWEAETVFSNVTYRVSQYREKYSSNFIHDREFDSAEDARNAAQTDYERRILSALTTGGRSGT